MKAITLWEPWASAMRDGLKTIETRSWPTNYRGDLVICAAKKPLDPFRLRLAREHRINITGEEFGCALCVVSLYDCVPTHDSGWQSDMFPSKQDRMLGDYSERRFAWLTHNLRLIDPVPVKGQQGLFNLPETQAEEIRRQLCNHEKTNR